MKNRNWASIIGWAIFFTLSAASLAGHYVFNPFIFGSAYYVIYVLVKLERSGEKDKLGKQELRLLFVCIIALLYLWFAYKHETNKREFIRHFEKTCYSGKRYLTEESIQLCEEIQSHIDSYLYSDDDDYD